MSEQPVIDGKTFARKALVLNGVVALSALPRLKEYLFSTEGEVHYTVSGRLSDSGAAILHLAIDGVLALICQRCLGAYSYRLQIASDLELVDSEGASMDQVDEDEALDAVVADKDMNVISLVEEEIILGLPMSPKHEADACSIDGALGQVLDAKSSAFSVLSALKKI
ncbi:MAG: YceD family protein [Burkholderiales bacterium]